MDIPPGTATILDGVSEEHLTGVSVTFKNIVWCTLRFSSSKQQSHAECMHFIKHTQ